MGTKLYFLGLFLALILPLVTTFGLPVQAVGVVLSAIGLILIFLDR